MSILETPALTARDHFIGDGTVLCKHKPTIQERFESYHAANPHVMDKLVQLAREVRAAGYDQIGIATLWERLRWHYMIDDREEIDSTGETFRLSNDFRSRYARRMMSEHPDLDGIFNLRELERL